MAGYPLEALRSLRQHRIDDTRRAHTAALNQYKLALSEVEKCENALSEYRKWREIEIENRYCSIMETTLSQAELEKFRNGISALISKELVLVDAVNRAQKEAEKAKEDESRAKQLAKAAVQALSKLDEHKQIWLAAKRIEDERREDLEMEDFKSKRPY